MFVALLLVAVPQSHAQFGGMEGSTASALSIPQNALMQPEALNHLLSSGTQKPLVLQVGSRIMFGEAHIPGSIYAGPGAQENGLQLLQQKVAGMAKNRFIVIYCGCCPWSHCPNMGPAFAKLRSLGFTNVKALYLAHNFGDDWVSKGYRVESGN